MAADHSDLPARVTQPLTAQTHNPQPHDQPARKTDAARVTLPLTAFLLRRGVGPQTAWTATSSVEPELYGWSDGRAESFDATAPAAPGDIVVAVLRRPTPPPAWQQLITDAIDLPGFGEDQQALGGVVFCAVADPAAQPDPAANDGPAAKDDPAVRWLAWTFGSGSRAPGRAGYPGRRVPGRPGQRSDRRRRRSRHRPGQSHVRDDRGPLAALQSRADPPRRPR
ncbi:MAG TPA: hypothetical protein VFI65_33095 [Streptosporangiaceae bacterium]|nr:hypothetical protein [Streptosporangiaceae bacterium]